MTLSRGSRGSRGSRSSADHDAEKEEGHEHDRGLKHDDSFDRRKSQAQRLLEFEMWTNDTTIKDLEYSQRRTEKKQRRKERRKDYQKRCWKKVYLPAVLGMVVGTFLTFCATLQSLAGDTFLWNFRGVLVILGPVLLGLGLLALMLAAGCTFKHDQEAREKPVAPPSEFVIYQNEFRYSYSRPPSVLRSDSVNTADFPVPVDLDPSRNYVEGRRGWSSPRKTPRTWSVSRDGSVHSGDPLTVDSSFSSTAKWVRFVSAAHGQQGASLPRQNSDSNLVSPSPHSQPLTNARRSLDDDAVPDNSGSQSDLHVVCTRSPTSSGYQSASDSVSGNTEHHVSFEITPGNRNSCSFTSHRHNFRYSTNHKLTKHSVRESRLLGRNQSRNPIYRGSVDCGEQHSGPDLAEQTQKVDSPRNSSTPHTCV
ncbi:uncharacterized protein LOC143293014 [Babylonia areolata]|uniref:uncharacterized protein LOC143293014 n=1 Tax=Babylonia areolata TaxID=304850 RepID=UPI003FD61333